MKTYTEEVEVELPDSEQGFMVAVVTVEAHEEDASFSDEFGVFKTEEIKIDSVQIEEILDEDGGALVVDNETTEELTELAEAKFVEQWRENYYD